MNEDLFEIISSGGHRKNGGKDGAHGMTLKDAVQKIKDYFHEPGYVVEAGFVEDGRFAVGVGVCEAGGVQEKKSLVELIDIRGGMPTGVLALRKDLQDQILESGLRDLKKWLMEI